MDSGHSIGFIGVAVLVALCVTIHPPTAVVLLAGLAALFFARVHQQSLTRGMLLGGAVVGGVAGALAWPYFPANQLLVAQPPEFHLWNIVFYQGVLAQIWPAMLALPVLAWRLRKSRRDPLVLLVLFLSLVYAVGGITGKYGLGRVIAYIVIFLQVALGVAMATWETRLSGRRSWLVPASTVLAMLGMFAYTKPLRARMLLRNERPLWYDVGSILAPVHPGEVVLADSRTSYMIPVLTGSRVVAWRHPVYWVPDHAERREAQDRFFAAATDEERRAVVARYRVQWILLNRAEVRLNQEAEQRLLALGCVVTRRDSLILLDVRRSCSVSRSPG